MTMTTAIGPSQKSRKSRLSSIMSYNLSEFKLNKLILTNGETSYIERHGHEMRTRKVELRNNKGIMHYQLNLQPGQS